jgi:hypothetical protein
VAGLVGGLDGGGPNDRVSYRPLYSDAVPAFFHKAARIRRPYPGLTRGVQRAAG